MAIIAFFASQTEANSAYALRLENNSLRQVWIGGMEPAMTEQRVEFVDLIFPHGILTR